MNKQNSPFNSYFMKQRPIDLEYPGKFTAKESFLSSPSSVRQYLNDPFYKAKIDSMIELYQKDKILRTLASQQDNTLQENNQLNCSEYTSLASLRKKKLEQTNKILDKYKNISKVQQNQINYD